MSSVVAVESAAGTAEWLAETGDGWHQRALADSDQVHLVGVIDGAVVGFVVLAGRQDPHGVIELRRIVVDAERRGIGIGRALLRAALAHAYDELGAQRVWLDVKPDNRRAIGLYSSEGFERQFTLPGVVAEPDGTRSDLVVMGQHPLG